MECGGARSALFLGVHGRVVGQDGVEEAERVVVAPEEAGGQFPGLGDECAAGFAVARRVGVGREVQERRRAFLGGPGTGPRGGPHPLGERAHRHRSGLAPEAVPGEAVHLARPAQPALGVRGEPRQIAVGRREQLPLEIGSVGLHGEGECLGEDARRLVEPLPFPDGREGYGEQPPQVAGEGQFAEVVQDAQEVQPAQRIASRVQDVERLPGGAQDLPVVGLLPHPGQEGQRFGQGLEHPAQLVPRRRHGGFLEVPDGGLDRLLGGGHVRARGVGGVVRVEGPVPPSAFLPDRRGAGGFQPGRLARVRAEVQQPGGEEGLGELRGAARPGVRVRRGAQRVDLGAHGVVRPPEQQPVGVSDQTQARGLDVGVGRPPPGASGVRPPSDGGGLQGEGQGGHGLLRLPGPDEPQGARHQGGDVVRREREVRVHDPADRLGLRHDPCDDLRAESGQLPRPVGGVRRVGWAGRRGGVLRPLFFPCRFLRLPPLGRGVGVGVGQAVGRRAVAGRGPQPQGETERGVAVRARGDVPEQAHRLVEDGRVAALLDVQDEIARAVHRVPPRVVSGLLGEQGPQRPGHAPVVGHEQQAEDGQRRRVVGLRRSGVALGQGPRPVVRGDRVQDVAVHRPSRVPRFVGDLHQRGGASDPGLVEHGARISAVGEAPCPSGQFTEQCIPHDTTSPGPQGRSRSGPGVWNVTSRTYRFGRPGVRRGAAQNRAWAAYSAPRAVARVPRRRRRAVSGRWGWRRAPR